MRNDRESLTGRPSWLAENGVFNAGDPLGQALELRGEALVSEDHAIQVRTGALDSVARADIRLFLLASEDGVRMPVGVRAAVLKEWGAENGGMGRLPILMSERREELENGFGKEGLSVERDEVMVGSRAWEWYAIGDWLGLG